jgi:hypothetical protein
LDGAEKDMDVESIRSACTARNRSFATAEPSAALSRAGALLQKQIPHRRYAATGMTAVMAQAPRVTP